MAKAHDWQIPTGEELETITREIEEHERARRRKYDAEHPDKVLKHRITANINFLRKQGFCVIPNETQGN